MRNDPLNFVDPTGFAPAPAPSPEPTFYEEITVYARAPAPVPAPAPRPPDPLPTDQPPSLQNSPILLGTLFADSTQGNGAGFRESALGPAAAPGYGGQSQGSGPRQVHLVNESRLTSEDVAFIKNRFEGELTGPLSGKFRVTVRGKVDLAELGSDDVLILITGKGAEDRAMSLFKEAGFVSAQNAESVRAAVRKSVGVDGGATMANIGVVGVSVTFPEKELAANVSLHEFGHAISRLGGGPDHRTGGVMQSPIPNSSEPLHFTPRFLRQFR